MTSDKLEEKALVGRTKVKDGLKGDAIVSVLFF